MTKTRPAILPNLKAMNRQRYLEIKTDKRKGNRKTAYQNRWTFVKLFSKYRIYVQNFNRARKLVARK